MRDMGDRSGPGSDPESLVDLLSDPHTRYLLLFLRQSRGPVDLSEAARHVAAGVTDQPPEEVPEGVRRRIQTWLHHGQLPALVSHGVVRYDPDSGTIALAEPVEG